MNRYWISALFVFLTSCMFATNAIAGDAQVERDIRKASDRFEALFANADAEGLTNLYTADAIIMPPGFELVSGSSQIRQFWTGFSGPGLAVTFDFVKVESKGDMATLVARYTFTSDGQTIPPFVEFGKYLVVWKRVNGEWKLHRDIWNVDPQ